MAKLDRLQFVKGLNPQSENGIFETREDAIDYVISKQEFERPALLAEPIILLYKSESSIAGPNVILAIGSSGNGVTSSHANKTFFIDTKKTEEDINSIIEELEAAIKSLTIHPLSSDTINLFSEKTDDGTFVSGDVKIADYRISSGRVDENIIEIEGEKGLYAFVDMEYDPNTFVITFRTNKITKEFELPKDQHVERGWYSRTDESIYLKLADNTKIKIDVVDLIDEWTVLPDSSTPVLLYKEHVSSITDSHDGVYDWQDVLTADVRVADHIGDNIIHKDRTGRYLYVKGTADNIKYTEGVTVKDALDNIDCKVSTSTGNLIYKRPDGIYATAMLDYNTAENKLKYTYSDGSTSEIKTIEFKLNSVKILDDITYDQTREVIVIRYVDTEGQYQTVEIPAKDIIEEWEVNNEAHNIQLVKHRSQGQGKDILSADAKIHGGNNNILEDLNHELYVNGISDNIKYDVTGNTTVKNVLDSISVSSNTLNEKIDQEIVNRTADVRRIDNTIGTDFTTDAHETVSYKFEQLSDKVDAVSGSLQTEISRSTEKDTEHDGKIQAIEGEIGGLQSELDILSANTEDRLKDIVNEDNTIGIDKTNPVVPIVKVNLSEAEEEPGANIIRIEQDGIYAGVDLNYYFDSGTSKNVLVFKTTNGTKTFDLKTNSVVDKIYYDPTREAIIIEYTVNGHRMPDVVVPVGDLINEWRVEDGHPHAVALEKVRESGATQDILKASVVITDSHDDNILVMDNGALYVSGTQIEENKNNIAAEIERALAAESALTTNINNEISRSTIKDQELTDAIVTEKNRATSAETALQTAINNEESRATTAENNISHLIADETERRISSDTILDEKITNEITRSTSTDSTLNTAITNEVTRAVNSETSLSEAISSETFDRVATDTSLQLQITQEVSRAQISENIISGLVISEVARLSADNETIKTSVSAETAAREAADDALQDAIDAATLTFDDTSSIDFNIPSEENNIVKATVKLQEGDNIIKCGQGLYASVNLSYNPGTNKIKLVTSNGEGEEIQLVGASLLEDLYYDPVNKTLVITYKDATGQEQVVNFGVSELFNEWSVNNPSEASAIELIKTPAAEPGGEDKLSGRVLLTNLPDNAVQIVNNGLYVSNSGDAVAVCSDKKANKIYKLLYGENKSISNCGEDTIYEPNTNGCIISAATSFNDADMLLNDAICNISDKIAISGSDTPSVHVYVRKIDDSNNVFADTRLSHGNTSGMTNEDLIITDGYGKFIDPFTTEFSNTNIVRVIDIAGMDSDNSYNGLYVSNIWNCGMYYSVEQDSASIEAAQSAGYNTEYYTDEGESAYNYNYMNNVRQNDNLE